MTLFERNTTRLRLIPLPPDLMTIVLDGWDQLPILLGIETAGLQIPEVFREEFPQGLRHCNAMCQEHPDEYRWYTNWLIVLRAENRVIGGMGLNGPADELGNVFTGYWIDDNYQRCGFMSEALSGLCHWVFEDSNVRAVTANTPEENIASQRVLLKNGFQRKGKFEGHPFYVLKRSSVKL